MSIERFIDVDLPNEAKRLGFGTGDLGRRAFDGHCMKYADFAEIIRKSQWPGLAEQHRDKEASKLVTRIYDQRNEGSCVANACSQAHEVVQALQFGRANVTPLSAISLYKRIGRSAQSGAMVSDGLEEMAERGVLPLDTPENRAKFGDKVMPNTGFRTAYPDGWQEVAKQFTAHEWTIVDSVEELINALFNHHPVVFGRSGHSICYLDPVYLDGALLVRYANSWSSGWGDKGFGYDSLRLIRSSASWAFALRSVFASEEEP
jgi:hypothetical protein